MKHTYGSGRVYTAMSLIIAYMLCIQEARCQLIGQTTQYYANELVINPAYAGASNALSVTAGYRSQWSGMEGAPQTQIFAAHSLTGNKRLGWGIVMLNDKIGVHRNLAALNSYSYRIQIDDERYFSFGMQVGFNYRQSDFSSLSGRVKDPNDPLLRSGISSLKFEVGSGFYYKSRNMRLGLSSPKMLSAKTRVNDSLTIHADRAQYFLFWRYGIPITRNLELQPGILIKYLSGLPVSADINVCADIKRVLLLGVSYRPAESIGAMLQLNITAQLKMGYAHDLVMKPVSTLSNSSHEIMINYLFAFTKYKIKNVR